MEFLMPRFGQGEQLLQEYEIAIDGAAKGRGSLIINSGECSYMLKEFRGTLEKARLLGEVLDELHQWDTANETIIATKEGAYAVAEEGGPTYILKTYRGGRECDVRNPFEVIEGARKLADMHLACFSLTTEQLSSFSVPEHDFEQELYRHNRELRNLKNYIRKKKKKNSFEEQYERAYDVFYAQAIEVENKLRLEKEIGQEKQMCHGDFHYHNLLDCGGRSRVVHYENMRWDSRVSDLAKYTRKAMEKNRWDSEIGKQIVSTYDRIYPLKEIQRQELYLRLCYPEKFWKIANHYNNNKKAWASKRDEDKLQQVMTVERQRQNFLSELYK